MIEGELLNRIRFKCRFIFKADLFPMSNLSFLVSDNHLVDEILP